MLFDKIEITGGIHLVYPINDKDNHHLCRKVLISKSEYDVGEEWYCAGLLDKKIISVKEADEREDIEIVTIDKDVLEQNGIEVISKDAGDPADLFGYTAEYTSKKAVKDLVTRVLNGEQISKAKGK